MTPEIGKMTQNLLRKLKYLTSCWILDFALRDFFVGIGVLHECTDFYTCMCNAARGAHRECLRWRCRAILPHPLLKHISDVNFRQF